MIIIMDGFGMTSRTLGNAIAQARTPRLDGIMSMYPHTQLQTCGEAVGLPEGQMGNSEVGHLNIGGGRIVYQDLSLIFKAIKEGTFFTNPALLKAMEHVKKTHGTLHLLGLLSDGGVHSHIDHLFALIDMAKREGIEHVAVHAFLDGRDVPPRCALTYLDQLQEKLNEAGIGEIATISGRYYAMDRDTRWEREELAYDAMTLGEGRKVATYKEAMEHAYENDENDEFVKPTVVLGEENSARTVNDGDSIIMFNFRPDRARQITRCFTDPEFTGFKRKKTIDDLVYICMTQYDATMPNVELAFPPEHYDNTLGEYLSKLKLKQLRIAETEKYAHVTFFFNGGVEEPNLYEDRVLIPSPKVATYDMKPQMSAPEITERVIREIQRNYYDVIILNFANADMVGHTGDIDAAIRAVETLEKCVPEIVQEVLKKDGQILLTADHGNADVMKDENGYVVTSHSLNPVPLVHIAKNPHRLKDGGKLADIAPTLLALMGLPIPEEMTGNVLLED